MNSGGFRMDKCAIHLVSQKKGIHTWKPVFHTAQANNVSERTNYIDIERTNYTAET